MELIDLYNIFGLYPPKVQQWVREDFAKRVGLGEVPMGDTFTYPTLDNVHATHTGTVSYTVVLDEMVGVARRKRHTLVFSFEVEV